MKLVWTTKALKDVKLFLLVHGRGGPRHLMKVEEELMAIFTQLQLYAGETGEPGVVEGTKEVALQNLFTIVFKVVDGVVIILDCSVNAILIQKSLESSPWVMLLHRCIVAS